MNSVLRAACMWLIAVTSLQAEDSHGDALGESRLFMTAKERRDIALHDGEAVTSASRGVGARADADAGTGTNAGANTVAGAGSSAGVGSSAGTSADTSIGAETIGSVSRSGAGNTGIDHGVVDSDRITAAQARDRKRGFQLSAVLTGADVVHVLINGQLCRTSQGPELSCSTMPRGVKAMAWEVITQRLVIVPDSGVVSRLGIGERWRP